MIISAFQFDVKWCESVVNLQLIERFIENKMIDSDVVVLPEMFTTGFAMKPEQIAEPMENSPTLDWMRRCAVQYKKAIVGSVAIEENGKYYNRLFFVQEDGQVEFVDKRHLFRMSGEDKVYEQGSERKIIEYKGVRFLPLVCYDLRFPVWARNVDLEYDVILYVASWPESRIRVWDTLLAARAIENYAYVVGANRVGDDRAGHYNGHSMILNYRGEILAAADDNYVGAVTATISAEELKIARDKFPVHLDRDNFELTTFNK